MLCVQFWTRRPVPFFHIIGCPAERLVDVALIARDGFACRQTRCNARRVDTVTTYRGEKRVARVGHMAIVTTASRRIDGMMSVLGCVVGQLRMALQTSLIILHVRTHLLIWIARMHRMTGQAGHASLKVARGFFHARELSPADTHGPIPPKTDIVWIVVVGQCESALIVATCSILVVLRRRLLVERNMALSTNLG